MNIVIGPLETFYIVGALLFLGIAILVYPTLRYGTKRTRSSKR